VARIGVDVDDVLVESLPEYLRLFRDYFGHDVPLEEAGWEIFRRFPQISPDQLEGFFAHLDRVNFLASRPVYPEARAAVRQLAAQGHQLIVVTGRFVTHARFTRTLLAGAGLLDAFAALVHRDGEATQPYKARIARERGLNFLVDDELHVAAAVAPVAPVLLMDRPWNRGRLPAGITRVSGWDEVLIHAERAGATR
jgi:uncharacterized HAD superfamily protein